MSSAEANSGSAAFLCVVLISAAGIYGYQRTVKWFFKHNKRAVKEFWRVSPGILHGISDTQEEVNKLSVSLEHARGVHELQNQENLQYKILDSKRPQTRILHFEPFSSIDDEISCTLTTIDIGSGGSYDALSYHWGSSVKPQKILLHGLHVNVTQNLYEALKELRARNIKSVWVDALCIDQKNHVEQSQIIDKMTSIYSQAENVYAWLGPDDPSFSRLKEIFDQLQDFQHETGFDARTTTESFVLNDLLYMWMGKRPNSHDANLTRLREVEFPKIDTFLKKFSPKLREEARLLQKNQLEFLESLARIVGNEYWRRAWILQELTVANQLHLICGEETLDFDMLCSMVQGLQQLAKENVFPGLTPNHKHIYNISLLRAKWQPREPIYLWTALQRSFGTVATEFHDKVYSLLGLCFDKERFVTSIDRCLCEDSSVGDCPCIKSTIRQMTENSIKTTKTLDVIAFRNSGTTDSMQLPSWAPDWVSLGGDGFNDRMVKYLTGQDEQIKENIHDNYWHASGKSQCRSVKFVDSGQILQVSGLRIGSIKDLSGTLQGKSIVPPLTSLAQNTQSENNVQKVDAHLDSPPRDGAFDIFNALTIYKSKDDIDDEGSIFKDLWDSRTMSRLSKRSPPSHEWLLMHRDFCIQGKSLEWWGHGQNSKLERIFIKWSRTVQHTLLALNSNRKVDPDSSELNIRIDTLADAVVRALEDGRRLMSGSLELPKPAAAPRFGQGKQGSTSGNFVGWAHPMAKPGDQVFLLEGCSMPMVLRPVQSTSEYNPAFQVIGDAYVANCMRGEAWPLSKNNLQDIYLV